MLPPDASSGLLPWRVMVPMMQMCGYFPYRMSATSDPPVFSLPLCLWSVFLMLSSAGMNCTGLVMIFIPQMTSDFGTAVYVCSITSLVSVMLLSNTIVAVRSSALAALLHDMSQIKDISPPAQRWYCRKKTLAVALWLVMFTALMGWFSTVNMAFPMIISVVYIPMCLLGGVMLLLPQELPSMVFSLLARRLLVTTEATVASVSALLAHDGFVECEGSVKVTMMKLNDLQVVIREVEVQQERAGRCFFPVINMFLLTGTLVAITSPYVIQQGYFTGSIPVATLLIACYIITACNHLGQAFVTQIRAAEDLLKDLKAKIRVRSLKKEVSQVMGSLSPLLTFDVYGWYTLSYSSLLTLFNTVLTYVVIILQVGGGAVEGVVAKIHTPPHA